MFDYKFLRNEYLIEFDNDLYIEVNHAKPIFTEAPKNLTVMQMGNAFLKVEILSDAEYFVMWMKHSPENPEIFETVEVHFHFTLLV